MFEKLKKVRNEASATSFYPFIHSVFTVVVSRLISQDPNKAAINCASMHSTGSYSVCVWGGVRKSILASNCFQGETEGYRM